MYVGWMDLTLVISKFSVAWKEVCVTQCKVLSLLARKDWGTPRFIAWWLVFWLRFDTDVS
jgi:hypothetical protein